MEGLNLTNKHQPKDNFFGGQSPVEQMKYQQPETQEIDQPQNDMIDTAGGDELDPDFLSEIETYLKECMENNELSIDMSDTLIKDHGAKMVAAAASLCDTL